MDDLDKLLADIRSENTPTSAPSSSYNQSDIDAFSLKGVRRPGSLVSRQAGSVDLTDFGSRMATGRKPSKKPPTEVEMEYFRIVSEKMAAGEPVPYLEYNGQRWYYNRGGQKGADGVKDLSLRSLSGKLKNEATYAAARDAQNPKLSDYIEAFGEEKGPRRFKDEQDRRRLQISAQKDAELRTGQSFDLDHMRPNMNQGRTHSRNFRLMDSGRNRLEQNRRPLSKDQLIALRQSSTNNVDYLLEQGPDMTPLQRQAVIEGPPEIADVSRQALGKPQLEINNGSLRFKRSQMTALAGAGLAGVSMLGTAASAAETVGRGQIAAETKNPMDIVQAGLSGLSLAGDFIPIVGEVVSTPADALNMAIDRRRERATEAAAYEQTAQTLEKDPYKPALTEDGSIPELVQTEKSALEKITSDPINELEYAGKQIFNGLKTVGGAILFGF